VVLIEKRHWAEPLTPATLLRGSLRLPTVREQIIVLTAFLFRHQCLFGMVIHPSFSVLIIKNIQTFGADFNFAPFFGCR
jgi:hypothetical protein